MELYNNFLIYAGLFRLAIISAGVLVIYFGYRLFLAEHASCQTTDAAVKVAGIQFMLSKAKPGLFFSLFGGGIILYMLYDGNPRLFTQTINELSKGDMRVHREAKTVFLKGTGNNTKHTLQAYESEFQNGLDLMKKGSDTAALSSFKKALTHPEITLKYAAQAFNEIAWIYQEQNQTAQALPLIELAVGIEPNNPAFLDTLANVLLKQKKLDEALKAAQQAVRLKPDVAAHLHTLALLYRAKGDLRSAVAQMEKAARLDERYQEELKELRSQVH